MEFELLKQVERVAMKCEKHDIPLVRFGNRRPFCTACKQEELEKETERISEAASHKAVLRRTVEVLEKDSIVGDESLWKATFDNYVPDNEETQRALQRAQICAGEYADKSKKFNTLFTGVPGVGKSHLAMSILKEVNQVYDSLGSCLFISVSDVLRKVKDSISNKQSRYTEENMVRLLTSVDLLVLDDFGSESTFQKSSNESSEYNQRFLFNVLNGRTRTIVTTNLSSEEMMSIYNQKIVSRLHRGVDGHIIKFTTATKDKRSKIKY